MFSPSTWSETLGPGAKKNVRVDWRSGMIAYRQLDDRRWRQREAREHSGAKLGSPLRVLLNLELVSSIRLSFSINRFLGENSVSVSNLPLVSGGAPKLAKDGGAARPPASSDDDRSLVEVVPGTNVLVVRVRTYSRGGFPELVAPLIEEVLGRVCWPSPEKVRTQCWFIQIVNGSSPARNRIASLSRPVGGGSFTSPES